MKITHCYPRSPTESPAFLAKVAQLLSFINCSQLSWACVNPSSMKEGALPIPVLPSLNHIRRLLRQPLCSRTRQPIPETHWMRHPVFPGTIYLLGHVSLKLEGRGNTRLHSMTSPKNPGLWRMISCGSFYSHSRVWAGWGRTPNCRGR